MSPTIRPLILQGSSWLPFSCWPELSPATKRETKKERDKTKARNYYQYSRNREAFEEYLAPQSRTSNLLIYVIFWDFKGFNLFLTVIFIYNFTFTFYSFLNSFRNPFFILLFLYFILFWDHWPKKKQSRAFFLLLRYLKILIRWKHCPK